MGQISFKISDKEMEFLRWFSRKTAQPLSSIYRNVTLDAFHQWKISTLIEEYRNGAIGFKQMCNLGNLSFSQGLILLQNNDVEPPIPEIVDDYTSHIREKMTPRDVFKNGKVPKRESKEVEPREK